MEESPKARRQRLIRETQEQVKQTRQKMAEIEARLEETRIEMRDRMHRVHNALNKNRPDVKSSEPE